MNKEIEELLKYLKNNTYITDETKRKYKILHRDEVNLLLSYIEQLEKDNQCKYRNCCNGIYECSYAEYEDMCNKNMEMALKLEQLEKELKRDKRATKDLIPYYKNKIKDLKKDNKDLDKENQILFEINLKLQNNRDKAIEYLNQPYRDNFDYSKAKLINILESDEQ